MDGLKENNLIQDTSGYIIHSFKSNSDQMEQTINIVYQEELHSDISSDFLRQTLISQISSSLDGMSNYKSNLEYDIDIFCKSYSCQVKTNQRITKTDIKCENCETNITSLWRRLDGLLVCNACALYKKLHGVSRPITLRNETVRKRKRSKLCV